ncbi:hypothetical protein [Tessaracoccus defluvii]|uniref:Uncharacterized protein n=1 Tax=Tessaracoccus defluvii TaxID=1285901 RepID=A0A7H0H593_9ACTN|nr:hypothetical protein [Tessaracoccus defluvii]QNP55709.1 hypothetical protein H9L22_16420 [Tessaracoccus defluvii]
MTVPSPEVPAAVAAGLVGTIEVLGDTVEDGYELSILTRDGEHHCWLPAGDVDPYGGLGAMRAVLAMAGGAPTPVPWSESRAVLAALADAVALADRR